MKIPDYYRYKQESLVHLNAEQEFLRNQVISKLRNGEYCVVQRSCPLCGSQKNVLIAERDFYGIPVNTVVCSSCDLVFQNPVPDQNALNSFYNNEYRTLDRPGGEGPEEFYLLQRKKGKRIFKFLEDLKMLDLIKGKLVLEVGCGAGGILSIFKENGFDTIGLDLGVEYLSFGRSQGLDLRVGTIDDVGHKIQVKSEIGIVLYEQVLEHIEDPLVEMEKLNEKISTETLLYIGVPGLRYIHKQYKFNFIRYLQFPHLVHYDSFHLAQLLKKASFQKVYCNERVISLFRKTSISEFSEKDLIYKKRNVKYLLLLNRLYLIRKRMVSYLKGFLKLLGKAD